MKIEELFTIVSGLATAVQIDTHEWAFLLDDGSYASIKVGQKRATDTKTTKAFDISSAVDKWVAKANKAAEKAAKPKKSTATDDAIYQENIEMQNKLMDALTEAGDKLTAPELISASGLDISTQKIVRLMGALIDQGKATKERGEDNKMRYGLVD